MFQLLLFFKIPRYLPFLHLKNNLNHHLTALIKLIVIKLQIITKTYELKQKKN